MPLCLSHALFASFCSTQCGKPSLWLNPDSSVFFCIWAICSLLLLERCPLAVREKKQIYSLLPESTKQNIQTAQSTKSLKRQTGCFYHEKAAAGLQQTDCRYTYYYGWQHCQRTTYLFLICLQTKTIIVFVCKTWSNQVIQNLFQVMCYALACCYDNRIE